MTQPTPHCADAALNDWLDDRLDAAGRDAVSRHCATCATCAGRLADLRRVLEAARAAPPAIEPPDPGALERAVAAAIAAGPRPLALPALPAAPAAPARPPAWSRRRRPAGWRVAAAVGAAAAIAATAAAFAWRGADRAAPPVAVAPPAPPAPSVPVLPAADPAVDVGALRVETDQTLAALRAAAAAGDRVLAAETLRVLERSLATIDAAIAEADAALARDPNNAALAALLSRTYERKQELVRRGALLGSRS
jgi:hypothetical protein